MKRTTVKTPSLILAVRLAGMIDTHSNSFSYKSSWNLSFDEMLLNILHHIIASPSSSNWADITTWCNRDWTHGFVMINGFNIGRYASQIDSEHRNLNPNCIPQKKVPYGWTPEDPVPPWAHSQSWPKWDCGVWHLCRSSGVLRLEA